MGSFKDLRVWQEAIDLAKMIYQLSRKKPFSKDYGLSSQIQRAAVSVSSNIAEGNQRWSFKESARFYGYANGSIAEVISLLTIAREIDYIEDFTYTELESKAEKINAMIKNLILSKKRQANI